MRPAVTSTAAGRLRVPTAAGAWTIVPRLALVLALSALQGCAVVKVREAAAADADLARRADVLSTGTPSADTGAILASAGIALAACRDAPEPCAAALRAAMDDEAALAAIAEVRTLRMQAAASPAGMRDAPRVAAHEAVDVARWAYAYLFMTPRAPAERVFESRQERVLRLYNRAVEVAAQALFAVGGIAPGSGIDALHNLRLRLEARGFGEEAVESPTRLLASDTLGFDNLRAIHRRDGFGSSLVAVFPPLDDAARAGERAPYRDTRYLPVTAALRFPGDTLAEVLATDDVVIDAYNPFTTARVAIGGREVPLAGNFSAAYGVWLAQSELARLSLSSLLRPRQAAAFDPRVYLTQPYDPDKRVVVLLHGLASSPEAWVNLANDLVGDAVLRDGFQVWQVFYPTNLGILASRARIARALQATFDHVDPAGTDAASRGAVLVGHSMGGVVARLLVTDTGDAALERALAPLPPAQAAALGAEPLVRELLVFAPLPQVGRVVFMATPHRGADVSDAWFPQLVRRAVQVPAATLGEAGEVLARSALDADGLQRLGLRDGRVPSGPDDLSPVSLMMRATAGLPMRAGLPYHSIIARRDAAVPLAASDDGLVPYASAHLPGAASETVVASWHSVQETPAAIIALRRILRDDLAAAAPGMR